VVVVEYKDVHANDINNWFALEVKIVQFWTYALLLESQGLDLSYLGEVLQIAWRLPSEPVHPTIKSRHCNIQIMIFGLFRCCSRCSRATIWSAVEVGRGLRIGSEIASGTCDRLLSPDEAALLS
jgi:hypothetical protein